MVLMNEYISRCEPGRKRPQKASTIVNVATKIDPAETRTALLEIADWVRATVVKPEAKTPAPRPARAQLAKAVRLSARMLAQEAPGHSVEVRVPPFVAVQCIEGPRHTRGTPPNVVEMSPEVWLALACGFLLYDDATSHIDASGTRAAEIAKYLPVCRIQK